MAKDVASLIGKIRTKVVTETSVEEATVVQEFSCLVRVMESSFVVRDILHPGSILNVSDLLLPNQSRQD